MPAWGWGWEETYRNPWVCIHAIRKLHRVGVQVAGNLLV